MHYGIYNIGRKKIFGNNSTKDGRKGKWKHSVVILFCCNICEGVWYFLKVQCNNLEMYPTNPREVTKKSHQRQRVTVSKPIEEIKME